MRLFFDTQVTYTGPPAMLGTGRRTEYLESSTIADLERDFVRLMRQISAENSAQSRNWQVVFIDLAGAGYGDIFQLQIELGDDTQDGVGVSRGVEPDNAVILLYSGKDAVEINRSYESALDRLATIDADAGNLQLVQTALAGASQNARMCGALVLTGASIALNYNPPGLS